MWQTLPWSLQERERRYDTSVAPRNSSGKLEGMAGVGGSLAPVLGWGVGVGCSHLAAKTSLHNPPPLPCPSQAPEALIPPDLHSGRIPASVSHPALHFWLFLNPGPRPVSQTLPSPVPFADDPTFIPNPIEGRREECGEVASCPKPRSGLVPRAALCSHHRSQLRTSYPGARISTQVAIPRGF